MQRPTPCFRLCATVIAMHAGLALTGLAHADSDAELLRLTKPENTVEVGLSRANTANAKLNEWNGLKAGGTSLIGNFELRGGSSYDSGDVKRWSVTGTGLGTDSRSLIAENGEQGRYRIKLGYDELLHQASNSFRTPYLGAGGTLLTLPSTWLVPVLPRLSTTSLNARGLSPAVSSANALVSGVSTAPTAAMLTQSAALQAADLPAFNVVPLTTQRTRFSMAWEQQIDARWATTVALSSEHQSGVKAHTAHADAPVETSTPLPFPVNQDDEKLQLGLQYNGDALHVQLGYDLSLFTNHVQTVAWNVWSLAGTATPVQATTSSGAPSNLFRKLRAAANYQLDPRSQLIAHASHATTWQNEAYSTDASSVGTMAAGYTLPSTSANAVVVNDSAGLKLVSRHIRNLSLSAGLKYDLRENQTPVNNYVYYDNNTAPAAALSVFSGLYGNPAGLGSNVNINANTPYSKRSTQAQVDADYTLGRGQHLLAGWAVADTARYCKGSWISCADSAKNQEQTLHADWRGGWGEDVTASFGLVGAQRRGDYNQNAFLARVPMANQSPSSATGILAGTTAYGTMLQLGLDGYGRSTGLLPAATAGSAEALYFPLNNVLAQALYGNRNRIVEADGLRRYDQADRLRNQARGRLQWQATEALALQAGLVHSEDRYDHSRNGLTFADTTAVNLEVSYATPTLEWSAFGTADQQRSQLHQYSVNTGVNSAAVNVNGATLIAGDGACTTTIAARNASFKTDPCLNWISHSRERNQTLGLSLARRELFKGQLDLSARLVYGEARSDNVVSGGLYANNPYAGIVGAATKDTAAYYYNATPLPTNVVRSLDLQLSGLLHLSPESAVRLGYGLRRLSSSDWGYEGMQPGGLAVNLPTFEQAPTGRIHTVQVSYVIQYR